MAGDIVVRNLNKRYGVVKAADDVSFEVHTGEIFGILGINGAGKTTLIECILGLREPDAGTIEFDGVDARLHRKEIKHRIGAQLQATALPDKITPREALAMFGAFYERQIDPANLIERFSITEKADARFDTLSIGQRQRLALALAYVNDPEALFLDEPTAGLDPQSRHELHQFIRQMKLDNRTVVLTTHHIDEAELLCDRVAIMHGGKIIAIGSPSDLTAKAAGNTTIHLRLSRPLNAEWLRSIARVLSADEIGNHWEIQSDQANKTLLSLLQRLEEDRNELLDLSIRKPTLEDFFLQITRDTQNEARP